jgi:lipid-binding SYLF domain-containing protein
MHTVFTHLFIAASVLLATPLLSRANADEGDDIDAKVNAVLGRFDRQVEGADQFLRAAKGMVVVPQVKKAGLIVAGQWGKGALRVGGKTVAYYKMEAGSAGLQVGYQEADFVFLFLTDAALQKFRAGKGWSVGAEAGITIIDESIDVSADTLRNSKPIVAFMIGKKGLLGGFSAEGTKFTRFNPGD